jgi:hypothetical protein
MIKVNGLVLQEKATEITLRLKVEHFKASNLRNVIFLTRICLRVEM